MKVIDAENCILGRLASKIAKMLLMGEKIIIVNADKIVVSGKRNYLLEFFYERKTRGDRHKGPFYSIQPNAIFRRAVRGMLPKNKRGREAFKNLMVYRSIPKNFEGKAEKLKNVKAAEDLQCKYLFLIDIAKELGVK
ncbi:MAG: 50S ribosomal protein L13 [Candidatus Aenigmatarchaeota archaeon]|nr:50S ribosomal protein L13 [Candidatus Aenigmarchaeota archaeon]